jgi:uncharacterized protein YeaO (DUF488 family)
MDVWREWKTGLLGHLSVQELEDKWGSRWRPGNNVRVQFCRRKVIWDELRARIATGMSEEQAVMEVERIRGGKSLNQLVDRLKKSRR